MSTPSKKRTGPTGLLKGLLEGLYEFTFAPAVDVAKRVESKALGRRDTALASTSSPVERLKAALDVASGVPLLAETAVDVGGDMASGLMSQGKRAADLFMGVERDKAGKLTGKVKESKPVQAVASAVPFLGPGIDEAVESGGNAEDVGRSLGQALAFYAGPKLAKKAPAAVRGLYESGKGETGAVKFGKVDKPLSAGLGDSLRKALEDMVDPRESQAESALTKGFTRPSEPLSSAEFKNVVPSQKDMGPVSKGLGPEPPKHTAEWAKSIEQARKPKVVESFNQIKGDPNGLIEVPSSRELGGGPKYITVEKYNKLSFSELANLGWDTPANVSKLKQGVAHTKNLKNYKRQTEGMAEKLQAATDDPTGSALEKIAQKDVGSALSSSLGKQLRPLQDQKLSEQLAPYIERQRKLAESEAVRESAMAEKARLKEEEAAASTTSKRGGKRAGAGKKANPELGKKIYDDANTMLDTLKKRFESELEWLKTGNQKPDTLKEIRMTLNVRDEIAKLEKHRDARNKRSVNADIKRLEKLIEKKGVLEQELANPKSQGTKRTEAYVKRYGEDAFEKTPDGLVMKQGKDLPMSDGLAEDIGWSRKGMLNSLIERFKGVTLQSLEPRVQKTVTGLKLGAEKVPEVAELRSLKAQREVLNGQMTKAVGEQDYALVEKIGNELTEVDQAIAKMVPPPPTPGSVPSPSVPPAEKAAVRPYDGKGGLLGGLRDMIVRDREGNLTKVESPTGEVAQQTSYQWEGSPNEALKAGLTELMQKLRKKDDKTFRFYAPDAEGNLIRQSGRHPGAEPESNIRHVDPVVQDIKTGEAVKIAKPRNGAEALAEALKKRKTPSGPGGAKKSRKNDPSSDKIPELPKHLKEGRGYGPDAFKKKGD